MHKNRNAYILLILTTLFWGGNAVAGKLAVGHVSPMLLTLARWSLAFAILALLGHRHLRRDWPELRRHLPLLGLLGGLGFAAFNIAVYTAVIHTTAINVSIEQAGMPMLIFMANFLFFGLRLTGPQFVGFVLSLIGVVLTASHGEPLRLLQLDVNRGDLMMLVGCLVYAAYTVMLRFKPQVHWISLMTALTAAASVATLPFALAEAWTGATLAPDATGWGVIAYTAIFPSLLGQSFFIRSIELIGSNRAGLFTNLIPIFGTLLSVATLGEAFHAYHAAALVLTLGGIWLAERSRRSMDGA